MKSFYETPRFNTNIRYGTSGGMEFKTDVTIVTSGAEHRLADWENTRGRWSIGEDAFNREELDELLAMFMNCRGRAAGFRFKDWSDWYATKNQGIMLTVPTNPTHLQLAKAYSPQLGGSVTYRVIRKPVPGTIRVWRNGILLADASVKIDYSTGLFLVPGGSATDTYAWSGEFDVPVRFDTDSLDITFEAYRDKDGETMSTVRNLPVVELMQLPAMVGGKVKTPVTVSVSTSGYVPPAMPEVSNAGPMVVAVPAVEAPGGGGQNPTPAPTPAPTTPAPVPQVPAPTPTPTPAPTTPTGPSTRNVFFQPFASTSIWNMPIGSGAVYVPAGLNPNPENNQWAFMPGTDRERICLTPTAPGTDIMHCNVGWDGGDRCIATGGKLDNVPMPTNFIIPNSTRNDGSAFLRPDNRTLVQAQPLTRCTAGNYATALVKMADVDIYGAGITGAHGGSGLSTLGGTIRLGELRPGQTGPKHALKVNVYAKAALFKATTKAQGFRWPANTMDSYGIDWYGTATNNTNTAMKMGSLLAIPASVDINAMGLVTEPAKQLAWTLQNYGAYIVDDTYAPGFDFAVEDGYHGSKAAEFKADFGFEFAQKVGLSGSRTQWVKDIQTIVTALHVVNNNSPTSIGGGGTPRQPLATAVAP